MDRISIIKNYVNNIINAMQSDDIRNNAYIHTYGVAQACSLLAGRRGFNTELAYISGLLHDIYAYKTGSYLCHSQSGAEMARPMLRDTNVFTEDEQILILSAIFHHANKEYVHGVYDEILKDADILQPFLIDTSLKISNLAMPRLQYILKELNIQAIPEEYQLDTDKPKQIKNRRLLLANFAEELAKKKVQGIRTDYDFMEMIKYYPEESSFDELKNSWCATFVYHCCMKTGIVLPLKPHPASCRLAGVGAWYEWGKYKEFCFYEKRGFIPDKGDIVIYNNIISPENKPKNSPWHDHIGIVLTCDKNQIIVAEGNVDNKNIAGIMIRKRDDSLGCYLRIPNDYIYDGWKYDYGTGKINLVEVKV